MASANVLPSAPDYREQKQKHRHTLSSFLATQLLYQITIFVCRKPTKF